MKVTIYIIKACLLKSVKVIHVFFLILPMNWCVDDTNVTIDFCAISKGFDVGGIDGYSVGQISCPESITHCRQKADVDTAEQSYFFFSGVKVFIHLTSGNVFNPESRMWVCWSLSHYKSRGRTPWTDKTDSTHLPMDKNFNKH